MRADEGAAEKADCSDPVVKAACLLDSEACPAECKESEEKEDVIVKSGDLAVKVTPATERKAIISGGVSDLDTITLKASEKLTVNSITLERFGYSTASDVESIWLEDANGNKIADEKSLSTSKDTVTLKIKKEYREMEESNALTIVLKTSTTAKAGGTIGFKVTDVDASAKNLDLSDYNPYTYELVSYDGSKVTVSVKGNEKTYNYEEWEFYEVSRIKVKAGASLLALNGMTLTNKGAFSGKTVSGTYATLDLDEFVSKVKVTADGKEVSGLKFNVTKDNELVLSWDTIEVAINKDVQLITSIAMENLDEFGKYVRLVLKEEGDLNATEKKTGARVTVTAPKAIEESWKAYQFNGSKIKFVNTKLSSTIDAAQGSEDVVIAKGKVTVSEEVKVSELVFTASTGVINDMTLKIAGETYDSSVSSDKKTFTFKNVFIEKSGELELLVDIIDEEEASGESVTIKLNGGTSIGKAIFNNDNGRYETSRENVKPDDASGSITISNVKVQESKGSFTNTQTTKKNVVKNESKEVEVFNGTYTAKKGSVFLDNVVIAKVTWDALGTEDITFKVTIDGVDVADIDNPSTGSGDDVDFDAIEVKGGESVNVKVIATAYAETGSKPDFEYKITVSGKDDKWNDAGSATKTMAKISFVDADKITVSTSTAAKKQDIILASDNQIISWFVVEPEKKAEEATIDDVVFDVTSLSGLVKTSEDPDNYFDFAIGTTTADDMSWDSATAGKLYLVVRDMDAKITKASDAKLTFTETLKNGTAAGIDYDIELTKVNDDTQSGKIFKRKVVDALVTVETMKDIDGETEYTFNIKYSDDATDESISALTFTFDDGTGVTFTDLTEWNNGYTAKNIKDTIRYVTNIAYTWNGTQAVSIDYSIYPDFFKVAGKRIQTFALK